MYHRAYQTASERRVEGMTRDEACLRFQRRVLAIARRMHEHVGADAGVAVEDLVGYGVIGLLEAFDRYEEGKGVDFAAFAEYRVRGAILDALRGLDTFTRRRRQTARRIHDATARARATGGGEPSPAEIAREMGTDLDGYWAACNMSLPVTLVPLESEGDGDVIRDALAAPEGAGAPARLAAAEARHALRAAIQGLPDRERDIVLLYYGRDLSLAEIGEVFGVTPSRICQVLSIARGKLRAALSAAVDMNAVAEAEVA